MFGTCWIWCYNTYFSTNWTIKPITSEYLRCGLFPKLPLIYAANFPSALLILYIQTWWNSFSHTTPTRDWPERLCFNNEQIPVAQFCNLIMLYMHHALENVYVLDITDLICISPLKNKKLAFNSFRLTTFKKMVTLEVVIMGAMNLALWPNVKCVTI